jgi:VanZ family protein
VRQRPSTAPPPTRHLATRPEWRYAFVLACVVLIILYGSLYPFTYRERTYPGGPVAYLLSTWQDWDHRGDLLSNILLYLPLGFFSVQALPSRLRGPAGVVLAIASGILLSAGVEITQFYDEDRITSMGDVYANTIGSAAGAVIAAIIGGRPRWPLIGELAACPRETMLLALWAGYRLYPYVPTIDLHKYWHTVRPLVDAPSLPPGDFAASTISWLFVASILHALYGPRRWLLLFPLLAGIEFAARILIVSTELKLADIAGAAAAFGIWLVLDGLPGRFAIVAVALATVIVAARLAPFTFEPVGRPFGWIPFRSLMQGSIGVAIQAFCEKFYLYGGLIWLLHRAGARLGTAIAATAALLLATSYAETHIPERSAEITDAVMALMIGGVFVLMRGDPGARVSR